MNMLKKASVLTIMLLIGLGASSISHAAKIYLWYTTDESGNRVPKYGETPPIGVEATLVSDTKTTKAAPSSSASDDAAEPTELTEEQKKMRAKREQECDAEEQRLSTLEQSGSRIRMANPDGTSRYLTPDEVLNEIAMSKDFLKNACGR